jgi:hypothetical protein
MTIPIRPRITPSMMQMWTDPPGVAEELNGDGLHDDCDKMCTLRWKTDASVERTVLVLVLNDASYKNSCLIYTMT